MLSFSASSAMAPIRSSGDGMRAGDSRYLQTGFRDRPFGRSVRFIVGRDGDFRLDKPNGGAGTRL